MSRLAGRIMTAILIALGLLARPAAAVFEKGGLIDAAPRSAALAGADFAADEGLAAGCAASLTRLTGPDALASIGASTRADLTSAQLRAGTVLEGLGLGASFRSLADGAAAERTWTAGLGLPVEEVPGLALGAGFKVLEADFPGDHATGFGLDVSVHGRVPVRVEGLELDAAAGVDDAFGGLAWKSGLKEDLSRQMRVGCAARVEGTLLVLAEGRLVRGASAREGIWAFGLEHGLILRGVDGAIRVGWRDGTQRTGTLSAGLGASYGPATVEYAIAGATRSQGYLHLVSVRWRLGAGEVGRGVVRDIAEPVSRVPAEGDVAPESPVLVASGPYRAFGFRLRAPRSGRIEGWTVLILDAAGGVVWSAEGDGAPPSSVEWSGATQRGDAAPAGWYRCQLVLRGPGAFRLVSPGSVFRLVRPPEPARGAEPETEGGF